VDPTPNNSGSPAELVHAGPDGFAKLADVLGSSVASIGAWMGEYGPFDPHPSQTTTVDDLLEATEDLHERLRDNYPFFHPRYVGQMLKPPHPAAVVGYLSAMLINPNNHALDGGPATAALEKEVVAQLAGMFGFGTHLGHLTSSGTIANLEALFVARETHPGKAIAHSADAHYTHARMSHLLGVESVAVPTASTGAIDLTALEELLKGGRIGTVVATTGTTGLGVVDPVHEIVPMCRRWGARVHVDAAYGGFFRLIADDSPDGVPSAPFAAIAEADSVVIDPHKHGLQPYGCGAVIFRDPGVARHYLHESPYTYFTSDELHLGEISLECSRAGAAAAALWLTLRLLPLSSEGLGAVLRPGRRAALAWADLIGGSDGLTLYQAPQLDIISYFPTRARLSEIDRASGYVLDAGMSRAPAESIYVATYSVDGDSLRDRGHQVEPDLPAGRILRSVLMKPEIESHVPALHDELVAMSREAE
jgi:glutamate/tyrosine decarboxylase-like PLP-dependent enzyme